MVWNKCQKNVVVLLTVLSQHSSADLRKATKNLSQRSLLRSPESNTESLKCEAAVLPVELQRAVTCYVFYLLARCG